MDSSLTDCQHLLARTLKHKAVAYKEFFHISKLTDGCSWKEKCDCLTKKVKHILPERDTTRIMKL